jgi:hypothetical protein
MKGLAPLNIFVKNLLFKFIISLGYFCPFCLWRRSRGSGEQGVPSSLEAGRRRSRGSREQGGPSLTRGWPTAEQGVEGAGRWSWDGAGWVGIF